MSNELMLKYCDIVQKKLGLWDRIPEVEENIFNYHTMLKQDLKKFKAVEEKK